MPRTATVTRVASPAANPVPRPFDHRTSTDTPPRPAAAAFVFVPSPWIPLAAFVVVDAVLGEIAHRRGRRTYGVGGGVK
ncbi:hypothetical protein [Streptomyces sp. NPDC101237]|uniref:hypothetical protein n=1 Tax=Streptomyces sp. NPDC101237 TaxID=3366139 RepID=UPI0038264263